MQTYTTETEHGKGEVRSWASLVDENCLEQALSISRVPILNGYLALMPDAHHGFGPPVGSALKTQSAVMPYAVGVDIGCGMIAVKTQLQRGRLVGHEKRILDNIRKYVPSGVGQKHTEVTEDAKTFFHSFGNPPSADLRQVETARIQFGTLGSGNHFVEVCEDPDGQIWIVLHSGSRGIGNQLATKHVKIAQASAIEQDQKLENKDFAWLHRWQPEFKDYITDMLWCQEYAYWQREAMMTATIRAVAEGATVKVEQLERINCHHNYAEQLPGDVWLTRKGAIDASPGVLGVIPGSMGAATYIVKGLGNEEAYNTSPHGAGRLLGRNVAKKQLSVEEFRAQMKGKTWLDNHAGELLDEAPFAYKPIETVIEDSKTLVEPVTVLSQFINYKGL